MLMARKVEWVDLEPSKCCFSQRLLIIFLKYPIPPEQALFIIEIVYQVTKPGRIGVERNSYIILL